MNKAQKLLTIYLCSIAALLGITIYTLFNSSASIQGLSVLDGEKFIQAVTDKPFQDTVDDASFAITERNFRVTNTLRIGNAIRVRGNKEFPQNDVILFCNIQYAEQMLELDPSYVNFCPGQITVREDINNKVIISALLVPLHKDNDALNDIVNKVNALVEESIEFAAEDWQEVYD